MLRGTGRHLERCFNVSTDRVKFGVNVTSTANARSVDDGAEVWEAG